jgi:hypothetical protein
MTPKTRIHAAVLLAATIFAFACSDSGGPPAPKAGTPAYYFQTAKDNYVKGDYAKAIDWLDKIVKMNPNEFTHKAWAMRTVLVTGLIGGYRELAENYEYGSKSNKNNPTPFIKKVNDYRGQATRSVMSFAETYAAYVKSQPPSEIPLDFPYPSSGILSKPAQLSKIAEGIAPKEGDVDAALTAMLNRGVVKSLCAATGAKEDTGKAKEVLLTGKTSRAAFETLIASTFLDGAKLNVPKLGGRAAVREFIAKQGMAALESAGPLDKAGKELKAGLEKELKEAKQN